MTYFIQYKEGMAVVHFIFRALERGFYVLFGIFSNAVYFILIRIVTYSKELKISYDIPYTGATCIQRVT